MLGSVMEISHANELNLLQHEVVQKAISFALRLMEKAIFVSKRIHSKFVYELAHRSAFKKR